MGGKQMNQARITSIEEIAPNVFELRAAMVEPTRIDHEPGQYVSIRIVASNEQRSYSLASPPGQTDGLALLVRRVGGTGSQFLSSLEVGAIMEFEGPRGDFRLAPGPGDAVFAATGVGVSALFPMMESLLARPGTGRVLFFWGLMNAEDQFWVERLARLEQDPRFSSRLVVTGAGEGFVTQPTIDTASVLTAPIYYLCGNGQMVKDVVDGLVSRGIDRDRQIRTDWA
ncbi:MAG: FAD-dependent oxidoreductase [Deltaproteobacteria bacterium]|nr:FAD-dependent oxidoreductase [Deltaproteobacteria bacterium]